MKRTLMAMVLALAAAGLASAQDKPTLFKAGGGLEYWALWTYQKSGEEISNTIGSWGLGAFVDVTDYFTAYAGLLWGMGTARAYFDGEMTTDEASDNKLTHAYFGAAVKYPFVFDTLVISPKLGVTNVVFLSGSVGDEEIKEPDTKQYVSPFSIVIGADFEWVLSDGWLVRVPAELGIALNSRLSDDFYGGPGQYQSSSATILRLGVEAGYRF